MVAFKIGGIKEIIDHKENGYIAEYKNFNDLINGINFILNTKNNLGLKAREKMLRNFDNDIIFEQYLSLYKQK